jgi:hypothetical protein
LNSGARYDSPKSRNYKVVVLTFNQECIKWKESLEPGSQTVAGPGHDLAPDENDDVQGEVFGFEEEDDDDYSVSTPNRSAELNELTGAEYDPSHPLFSNVGTECHR